MKLLKKLYTASVVAKSLVCKANHKKVMKVVVWSVAISI